MCCSAALCSAGCLHLVSHLERLLQALLVIAAHAERPCSHAALFDWGSSRRQLLCHCQADRHSAPEQELALPLRVQALLPEKLMLFQPNLAKAVGSGYAQRQIEELTACGFPGQQLLCIGGVGTRLTGIAPPGSRSLKPCHLRAQALLPEKRMLFQPNLAKAVGSDYVQRRIEELRPAAHVFGHTHFSWDTVIDGVRYVQWPLAYPQERQCARFLKPHRERSHQGSGCRGQQSWCEDL